MPIVSIDNEDDKNTTGSTTSLQGTGATEKVVIKRSSSAQLRAANKKLQRRRRTSTIIRYTVLTVVGLIMIYPLVWMVGATFKENSEIFTSMNPIPLKATFNGYKNAIKSYGGNINIWKAMLNTYSYVVPEVILTVISSVLTAYGFARFKFKGKNILFAIVTLMIIVPPQIITIPLFMQYSFGWITVLKGGESLINSPLTMYLPALFANGIRAGLFIYIFRQFFRGLPKELEDAAYLDGCGPLRTYVQVMIPNAKTSFLTVFLFAIVWYWNDFYISSSYFTRNDTVALMLKNLDSTLIQELFAGQQVGIRQMIVWLEAGCILSITPILIMYVFLQRYFIEGVERSGITGI